MFYLSPEHYDVKLWFLMQKRTILYCSLISFSTPVEVSNEHAYHPVDRTVLVACIGKSYSHTSSYIKCVGLGIGNRMQAFMKSPIL